MRRLGFVMLTILLACLVTAHAQFGVLGRSVGRGQAIPAIAFPCDVGGCAAAYSMDRRIVSGYSGSLFQLQRASDAATTNIGLDGSGFVNTAAVSTFCAATTCTFQKLYDQTGNSDLSLHAGYSADPYLTDAVRGWPELSGTLDGNSHPYWTPTPGGAFPAGNVDKSVYVVASDKNVTTGYAFNGAPLFGTSHECVSGGSCPFLAGNMMQIAARRNVNDYRMFSIWLENDVLDDWYNYDVNDPNPLSTNLIPMTEAGDFVGIGTYHASDTTLVADMNGTYVFTTSYPTTITGDTEIHVNGGGDFTPSPGGALYEGIIFNKTLSATERAQLRNNASAYYALSLFPTCGAHANTVTDVLGTTIRAAYGTRVINPIYAGPIVTIKRASDGASRVVGRSGCNLDTATAATFCASTTCTVTKLWNQVGPPFGAGQVMGWFGDPGTDTISFATTGGTDPSYTANCLGSLPCLTSASAASLVTGSMAANPPYTVLAVYSRSASSGVLLTNSTWRIGGSAGTGLLWFRGDPASGGITASATENTWHAVAAQAVDATHSILYVDGAATSGTDTLTSATAAITLSTNPVSLAEIAIVQSAPTATQLQAIATGQRSYWGF